MIEWVPIKDFLVNVKIEHNEHFLVCDRSKIPMIISLQHYSRNSILSIFTHAAKISLPVEKTLEEKLSDYWINTPNMINLELIEQFARIAKEHYEGKE
jgi:hypothetical protein